MASSAFLSSVSTARPSAGATVMPTLALICTSRVRITNGEAKASLSRRVSSAASSGRLMPVCRIRNSSLSRRASSSSPVSRALSRTATSRSSSEPNSLPNASLMPLNRSRSRCSSASISCCCRARASSCSKRVRKCSPLGRPVSGSSWRGAAVAASAARSSVTSRATVSTSAARPEPSPSGALVVSSQRVPPGLLSVS